MPQLRGVIWLVLLLAASPAHAHAPVPGLMGFYVGLLHPFSTPAQALVMVGLGLLIGGFSLERTWVFLGGFLIFSLLGVFVGVAVEEPDPALFAVAVVAASLAALAPGRLLVAAVVMTVIGGFLIGVVSVPDDGPVSDRVFTMSGSIVGANVGLLYLFGLFHFVRQRYTWPWVAIALRVAAAWLAAVSLLMLALGYVETVPPVGS